jgi:hypothetical protein
MSLDDPIHSLAGNAKHHSDLGNPDKVVAHPETIDCY